VIARLSIAALLVGAMLAGAGATAADDVRIRAYLEPSGRAVDTEPLALVIQVEGSNLPDVSVRELPRLLNLRVLNGPNKSSSTSFEMQGIQVRRSATVVLRYTLLPEGPGAAEIPPIAVYLGSEVRRTEAIRFEVARGMTAPRSEGRTPRPRQPDERRQSGSGASEAFLEVKAGATDVWVRQPIPLTVTLYASGVEIHGFSWVGFPSFSNFWVEEVPTDANAERYQAEVAGRTYNAYPMLRRLLVPTAPGEIVVEPFVAQLQVRRSTGDLFQDFFTGGGSSALVRKSEPLRFKVRPLPAAGKPADFGGAVGAFKLRSEIDRTEAQVNDAVALKVTVEGDGSLQSVPAPRLDAPADLKVFDPKVTDSATPAGGKLKSVRTWEWVLVPLAPGEIRLPPVRFSYFDPAAGAYREARGEASVLAVRRSDRPSESPVARGAIKAERSDIAFIKPLRGKLSLAHPRLDRRPGFMALLVLPWAALPVVIGASRYRARLSQDRGLARARRARALARKRLKAAEHHLGGTDAGAYHEGVARALVEFVADRFDRPPAGLTYDVADELLAGRNVDLEARRRFRACLETCDFARFVPDSGSAARKTEILKEAREILDLLEKGL
jgi:hypothetical protein